MPELLDLPPELVLMIATYFLPWGYAEYTRCTTTRAAVLAGRASLNAMSQTCKMYNNILRPILYLHSFTEDQGCVSLVRTLSQKPELAQAVKVVFIREWGFPGEENEAVLSQKDIEHFNDLFEKHGRDVNGEIIPISQDWYRVGPRVNPDELVNKVQTFYRLPEIALSALLVMLLPNLIALDITSECLSDFPLGRPNALPHLICICLRHLDADEGEIDLAILKNIWLSAPKLEHIVASQVFKVSAPLEHKAVKRICLEDSSLCPEDFRNLVCGLENLESFTFEFGGSCESAHVEITPQEIMRVLHNQKDTLKYLYLDSYYFGNYQAMTLNPMGDLRHMKVLDTLEIEPVCFNGFAEDPQVTVEQDLLTSRLPPSIRDLTLMWPLDSFREAIVELARATPGRFPLLKSIYFVYAKRHFDEDTRETIRKAFEASGVEFGAEERVEEDQNQEQA